MSVRDTDTEAKDIRKDTKMENNVGYDRSMYNNTVVIMATMYTSMRM